jgi:hypothetical protein
MGHYTSDRSRSSPIRIPSATRWWKVGAAAAYEFYAYENEKTQGAVRLFVANDTGLPLRLEMGDPNAGGGIAMNYGELSTPVNIEVPACMGSQ